MNSPSPLADVFKDFEKLETDHMDTVWDCLENRADAILEEQRRVLREMPVYTQSGTYAHEHGELEQYRASNEANMACKQAVEDAMDTLGENYTPDALRAIVSGARRHTPKKKRSMDISAKPSGSLLIDIQAKLQEGKCAGYARWAKNFNLKQLSQTLIYLEENGLLDRGILEERTATATSRYRTLSTDIKAKEQRIAEIKIMQQHIINYAKTRNVYVAYRKAGYSKKFLAEHESEIILHKAAKQFFDEQGLKKLPTVKSLQAEYTQLLSEKKAIYADYQKARDEMRSLQTAKANVDRILGEDALPVEREPEKDGR